MKRSLSEAETAALHNAWMNDVSSWMTPDCLQQYDDLIQQADELGFKGKGKSKGKNKGEKAVLINLLKISWVQGDKLTN